MSVNNNFFSEPSELSAYWAGFIAADGCVMGNRLQIGINKKDLGHIERFLSDLDCTAKISHCKDGTVRINVTSKQIVADLKKHYSVTERKSLTLAPPNITEPELVKAFIAGYWDGDGCTRYGAQSKTGNYKYIILEAVGTEATLNWIAENLPHAARVRSRGTWYSMQYTGRKAFEVYHYLKDDSLPLLPRKWNKQYRIWSPRVPV